MNKFSRIRHHIDMKDVKKRHLEELAIKKLEEEKKLKEERILTRIVDKKKSNWKNDLSESDWSPVTSSIANRATQTFQHISGTTATFAGLGGVEVHPSNVTIDGENVSTPTYSDLALAGYAKPLGSLLRKKNKEDEEEINSRLDAGQEVAKKANADVMMNARVTPPIPDEPLPPGTKWELIPATYGGIVDGQWDPKYMVAPPSWTQVNKDPEPVTPKVTTDDERFLKKQQTLVNLTKSLNRIGLPNDFAQWTINYAKGDMTPITQFSSGMERQVLDLVDAKFAENPNATTVSIQYDDYGSTFNALPTRLGLGRFTATKLSNGDIKITDTFNVDKTFKTVGAADIIPGLQKTADRLVDIAYKRRSIGGVYDEGGIPINVIIRRRKKK